jgi:hypothetical protein
VNNSVKSSPMLKAAPLWAKSSVKGGQYLTGRLGGVKVLILENRERKTDDDPSHHLFFVEAPDRRQGADAGSLVRSGGAGATHPPQTPRNASAAARGGFPGHRDRVPDHQAPLDRDGPPPARDVLDDVPEWAR